MKALTTTEHWDRRVGGVRLIPHRGNETTRILAPFLKSRQGGQFIEMGCGNSAMLPYVARTWGYCVSGMDLSAPRLARAARNLRGVACDLMQADFTFTAPPHRLRVFDVVYSAGVIEHFSSPSDVLKRFAEYLQPGGIMLTTVPYLQGWLGQLDRRLNPDPGYVTFDLGQMVNFHEQAGLRVLHSAYFRWADLSMVNFSPLPLRSLVYGAVIGLNLAIAPLRRFSRRLPRCLYADMVVVARKE